MIEIFSVWRVARTDTIEHIHNIPNIYESVNAVPRHRDATTQLLFVVIYCFILYIRRSKERWYTVQFHSTYNNGSTGGLGLRELIF